MSTFQAAYGRRWAFSEKRVADLVLIAVLAAHIVQVWAWPYPPLLDWPNHMARHHLEALALSGQALPQGIEVVFAIVPNLGGDLLIPLLLQVFPLTIASRLFLTFNVLVCGIGFYLFVRMVSRQSSYPGAAAILVLPWILTGAYFSGFLNFTSGLGLAFLVACNYLRLSNQKHPSKLQFILHGAAVAFLYVWHLAALVTYVLIHVAHVLAHFFERSRSQSLIPALRGQIIPTCFVFMPIGVLLLVRLLRGETNAVSGAAEWRSIGEKVKAAGAVFATYDPAVDALVLILWLAAVLVMVRLGGVFRLPLHWLHLAVVLFFSAFVVIPFHLGTTWGADSRMLPPLLICGIGLLAQLPVRNVRLGALLILSATMVKLTSIERSWRSFDVAHASHLEFIKTLPYDARILSVTFHDESRFHNEAHVVSYAVPFRNAFVSSLFAIPGQQPLRLPMNDRKPLRVWTPEGTKFDIERLKAEGISYVWVFNPLARELIVPANWTRVYSKSQISVWHFSFHER